MDLQRLLSAAAAAAAKGGGEVEEVQTPEVETTTAR